MSPTPSQENDDDSKWGFGSWVLLAVFLLGAAGLLSLIFSPVDSGTEAQSSKNDLAQNELIVIAADDDATDDDASEEKEPSEKLEEDSGKVHQNERELRTGDRDSAKDRSEK